MYSGKAPQFMAFEDHSLITPFIVSQAVIIQSLASTLDTRTVLFTTIAGSKFVPLYGGVEVLACLPLI